MRSFIIVLTAFMYLPAAAAVPPEQVPLFKIRARATSVQGHAPAAAHHFAFSVAGRVVDTAGDGWSDWIPFDRKNVDAALKEYPNSYMDSFPVVTTLSLAKSANPTRVEAEVRLEENGKIERLTAELFGPRLGVLLDRDAERQPHVLTMAQYNRRFWKLLDGVDVPPAKRPRKFPIVDRFIGGDDDTADWTEGINGLARAGFSAIGVPPQKQMHLMLAQASVKRTAWAVYSPPGYAFAEGDAGAKPPQPPDEWAKEQAKAYLDAGFEPHDVAMFAMSDEPGWYYPHSFALANTPEMLKRFHEFLRKQGLTPADVGADDWSRVRPSGRSHATSLPARRLFYWSMRFFPQDSAQYFAACTREMERAFYPGMPLSTNWNFFSGRLYVPGPAANNPDKQSPDAAMGGHDWFEFGRMRGCTALWTEDWFSDAQAYQWSFYAARLRCASEKGGVTFGGYVVPRASGDRKDGLLQKMLCLIGSGAKLVNTYVFGPEYNFPGNCYSARPELLARLAEANGMIGAAEDVLWEGKRPRPQVAILAPRSAELWDQKTVAVPTDIQDATMTNLNGSTVDYVAEVFDLYLALQHANIPVDFVDEDDLSANGLQPYRVLYVTEPNVPAEGQKALASWAQAGGTLVTVSGAAMADRYDEPCAVLADLAGIHEKPRERLLVRDLNPLKEAAKVSIGAETVSAIGVRGELAAQKGEILATFADGAPATIKLPIGKGSVEHFAWMPGLSYARSSTGSQDKLPVGFSTAIRGLIVGPVHASQIEMPVTCNAPMVETPVLQSEKGAAITVLNWTGQPIPQLQVTVKVSSTVKGVQSVRKGQIAFVVNEGKVHFTMPLESADIVMLKP